jgi:HlyD family secretion protein
MKRWINLLIITSLFIFISCGESKNNPSEQKEGVPKTKSVRVREAKASPSKISIDYVGTLKAHRKVNVATELGGTIEGLYFERGDHVKEGQLLTEISTSSLKIEVQRAEAALSIARSNLKKTERGSRPEEIQIAAAGVEQAEANLMEVEKNFKRIEDLHKDNAVAQREYDAAKRALDTALANLDSAKQRLELAKKGPREEDREAARARFNQAKSALSIAWDRFNKSRLHSPSHGIVAFRKVEEGEVVSAGTILTQIVDNSRMKVTLSLAEKDISLLQKDRPYSFTLDALPEKKFSCRLTFLSPTADLETRSFPVELHVDQPGHTMADGMTARVHFPFQNQLDTIKVSSAWLTEQEGHMGLFVVEKGKAVFRKVTLGSYYEQKVEILSGLSGGELVITTPAGLRGGDFVSYEFRNTKLD